MRDDKLRSIIAEREGQIHALRRMLERSNWRVMDLERRVSGPQNENAELRRALFDKDEQLATLRAALSNLEGVHVAMPRRLTALVRRLIATVRGLGSQAGRWSRLLYRGMPASMSMKMRCKGIIFRTFAPLLGNTRSYRAWLELEGRIQDAARPLPRLAAASDVLSDCSHGVSQAGSCSPSDLGEAPGPCGAGEVSRVLAVAMPFADAARFAPSQLPDQVRPAPHQVRILMIDEWVPTPDRSSGSFRLLEILKAMREIGCRVELAIHHGRKLHETIAVNESDLARYEKMVCDLSITLHFGQDEILAHLAAEGQGYSHVWLNFPSIAREYLPWVRTFAFHAKLVFDSVDLHHVRYARQAELTGDPEAARQAGFYKRLEKICCRSSDITIAITEEERRQLLALSPSSNVMVVPNIHPVSQVIAPISGRTNLLFIGGFRHQPNVDAVNYFVEEIFPLVRSRLPMLEFVIIGSNMPASILDLAAPGIRPVGYIENPEPYFQGARVFVAPLRYGAGMKGKLGQALSAGLPSVTTPIGAEGMYLEHGRQLMIAETSTDFAEAIVRLCTDDALWNRLSERGLKHIDEHFSPAAIRTRLESIFYPTQALPQVDAFV